MSEHPDITKERSTLTQLEETCNRLIAENSQLTKERDELAAKLKEQSSHIRCIYCNAKYTAEQSGELADHILSCEKSPLVQMNAELMEFANLIIGSSDPDSVIIEAEKRIKALPLNSILKQRDDYKDKLALSESQVVQLLDENNSLKLDYSHSEAENAQLAAKCAAYKHVIQLAWEDRRDDSEPEYVGKLAEAKCNDQCGVGWLSPEKAKVLMDLLRFFRCETCNGTGKFTFECQGCLTGEGECTCDNEEPSPCPQCQVIPDIKSKYDALEQALEACK